MPLFLNNVTIAGNLTRDPEVKFLANEKAVCNFSIAINKKYKDRSGETVESVLFVDVEAWGRTAELCGQYLTKGKNAYIEGELRLDTWEKDGEKRSRMKVNAYKVQFLSPPDGQRDNGQQRAAPAPQVPPPSDIGESEEPF